LVRRIRLHWPNTRITIRGDSHHGRREAMDWCAENGIHYIFGLSTNTVLAAQVFTKTDEVCVRRAIGGLVVVRDYTETRYAAKSWSHLRRRRGVDHPFDRH
jgi:ribosomal protein S11